MHTMDPRPQCRSRPDEADSKELCSNNQRNLSTKHDSNDLQEAMAEALAELEVHNISTAPKFGISLSSLQEAASSEEACTQLYEQMKEAVGEAYSYKHLTKVTSHHCRLIVS